MILINNSPISATILDMDGVLWRSNEPLCDLKELFSFIFKKDRLQPQVYEPLGTLVLCNMAKTDCCINPKGEVYPCAAVPIEVGNLRKETFKEIWQTSPVLNKMRSISSADLKECAECRLAPICIRCPGLSLLEENDLLSVPHECCRITKAVKEVIDSEKTKV
jgi:radical SAM protein with 4Fe4S-binding SPASM domain